jgi:hypothetical protein
MRISFLLLAAPLLLANQGGCEAQPKPTSAQATEQHMQNLQMEQFLRNQPVPSFDFSLERHILIKLYGARQRATNTFSVVQSPFTGKVLWSCASIGFPLPYATQLTNPQQVQWKGGLHEYSSAVLAQQEPNGLFTPASAEGTWVPCVDEKGNLTPVYEEKKVTVFLRPMQEVNGQLVPAAGSQPSLSIPLTTR